MPKLEAQLKVLEQQMITSGTDYAKLTELSNQHTALKGKVETLMNRWTELAERSE
jgi:hypothetical protein